MQGLRMPVPVAAPSKA